MNLLTTISTFFTDGGPFMYVILCTAVVALATIVERTIVIGRATSLDSRKLLDDIIRHVRKGDLTAARRLCAEAKSPTTAVACAILDAQSRDEQKLTAAADGAAVLVLPPLSRRIPHLNMLANTATLLGLLGTIFGLMTAFSAVGAADPSQRSTFLASGIAQALNTTAFGLIVAVPTILVQGFLVERVEGIVARIDEVTVRLIETLTRGGQPASALPAGTPARRQVA